MKALGINCGPGILLHGASRYFDIVNHFHWESFGAETCGVLYSIPTTQVDPDYSRWPAVEADCVFANAETWAAVQSAAKYIYAQNVPIGIIDVRGAFWLQYESVFNALTTLGQKNKYRTCYLTYPSIMLDAGFCEPRFAFVTYQKDKNFNITMPKLPKTVKSIYDYLENVLYKQTNEIENDTTEYNQESYYKVEYDEKLCLRKVKAGFSLRETFKKARISLPGTTHKFLREILHDGNYMDLKRASWGFKLSSSSPLIRWVHPEYDRQFTIGEMMLICEWNKLPCGHQPIEQIKYGTPFNAAKWLGLQALSYLQDKWKEKDYYLTYDKKKKKFVGGTANPLHAKKYVNLNQYKNLVFQTTNIRSFPPKPVTFAEDDELILF